MEARVGKTDWRNRLAEELFNHVLNEWNKLPDHFKKHVESLRETYGKWGHVQVSWAVTDYRRDRLLNAGYYDTNVSAREVMNPVDLANAVGEAVDTLWDMYDECRIDTEYPTYFNVSFDWATVSLDVELGVRCRAGRKEELVLVSATSYQVL